MSNQVANGLDGVSLRLSLSRQQQILIASPESLWVTVVAIREHRQQQGSCICYTDVYMGFHTALKQHRPFTKFLLQLLNGFVDVVAAVLIAGSLFLCGATLSRLSVYAAIAVFGGICLGYQAITHRLVTAVGKQIEGEF